MYLNSFQHVPPSTMGGEMNTSQMGPGMEQGLARMHPMPPTPQGQPGMQGQPLTPTSIIQGPGGPMISYGGPGQPAMPGTRPSLPGATATTTTASSQSRPQLLQDQPLLIQDLLEQVIRIWP